MEWRQSRAESWKGLKLGIYDCFERHIEQLECFAAGGANRQGVDDAKYSDGQFIVRYHHRSGDDWFCLMPGQRHLHAVVIQRLPVQKIDEFLRRVELGEFEIVI